MQSSSDFMAAVTIRSEFGAQEEDICLYFHLVPFICHEVMRLDAMILVFGFVLCVCVLIFSLKPAFSLSSFTFIKRLFSSSFSAIGAVSSAYLRLLIFLKAVLIPACASSSLAFHMMYSAYKYIDMINRYINDIYMWII